MLAALSGQSSIAAPTRANRRRFQYKGKAYLCVDTPAWSPDVSVILPVLGTGGLRLSRPDDYNYGPNIGDYSLDLTTRSGTGGAGGYAAFGATGARSVAIGYQATASASDSVAIGGRAQGTTRTIGIIGQVVSGSYGIAIGQTSYTSADGGVAIGNFCTASGSNAIAIGACNGGGNTTASGANSFATGFTGTASIYGQDARSIYKFATAGDSQISRLIAQNATTNATPTNLFLDGSSARITIPANTTWKVNAYIVARTATGTGTYASFERKLIVWRGVAAGTTVATTAQTIGTDEGSNAGSPPAGWAVALTADTTNGALDIQVTGAAATNIRWVAHIMLTEVAYP